MIEIILGISTLLGGIVAIWFLYEQMKSYFEKKYADEENENENHVNNLFFERINDDTTSDKITSTEKEHYSNIKSYLDNDKEQSLYAYLKKNFKNIGEWIGYNPNSCIIPGHLLTRKTNIDLLMIERRSIEVCVYLIFFGSPLYKSLDNKDFNLNLDKLINTADKDLLWCKLNSNKVKELLKLDEVHHRNNHHTLLTFRAILIIGRNKISSETYSKKKSIILESKNIEITHYDRILFNINEHYELSLSKSKVASPKDLIELSKSKIVEVRKNIINNYELSEDILYRLSEDKNIDVRYEVALSQQTPKNIFLNIAGINPEILLKRKDCPIEVFNQLIKSKDNNILLSIASHSNLYDKDYILNKLLSFNESNINKSIIKNKKIDNKIKIKLINKLCNSKDHQDRRFAASSDYATKEILDTLSNDNHWVVRKHVLMNKNVTEDIVDRLVGDEDKIVRTTAKKHNKKIKRTV